MKFTILTIMFLAIASLSACNTFEGMGQDIKNGGQDVENAADRNK